jgi:hypothetical protein
VMNWKGCARKRSWSNFKVLSQYLPGRTEGNHKKNCQDSRSLGRDLNPDLQNTKAEVLTSRPRRSLDCSNVALCHGVCVCMGGNQKINIKSIWNEQLIAGNQLRYLDTDEVNLVISQGIRVH